MIIAFHIKIISIYKARMSDNNDDDDNNGRKGSWLQSTANFFIIVESVFNIATYLSQIYYAYHDRKQETAPPEIYIHEPNVPHQQPTAPPREGPPRSPSYPSNPPDDEETDDDENACKICFTNRIRTVNLPCGHLVFCFQCTREFVANNIQHVCPICRERITQIKMIFN